MNVQVGKIYKCRLTSSTMGRKRAGTRVKEKTFAQGKEIDLLAINNATAGNGYMLAFQTKDEYIIPRLAVYPIAEVGGGNDRYEDAVILDSKGNKKTLDIKTKKPSLVPDIQKNSKIVFNFAAIGGGYMLYKAFKGGKSKLVYTAIGITLGGIVGNGVSKLLNKTKK